MFVMDHHKSELRVWCWDVSDCVTDGAPHGRCRDGVAAGIAAVLGDVAASNVVLELSEDGSGLGAAVIACTASSV